MIVFGDICSQYMWGSYLVDAWLFDTTAPHANAWKQHARLDSLPARTLHAAASFVSKASVGAVFFGGLLSTGGAFQIEIITVFCCVSLHAAICLLPVLPEATP